MEEEKIQIKEAEFGFEAEEGAIVEVRQLTPKELKELEKK